MIIIKENLIIMLSIHPLIAPWAQRRCPISPHFLTRWVSRLLGQALVSWAFARVGVHRLPFAFHISVFSIHSSSLAIELNSCFLFSTDVSAPIGQPFTYSLFRWVSRLGTGSGTRCCGSRGGAGMRMKQKFISFKISALAGVWTSNLAVWWLRT